jgi:hypothetical protein
MKIEDTYTATFAEDTKIKFLAMIDFGSKELTFGMFSGHFSNGDHVYEIDFDYDVDLQICKWFWVNRDGAKIYSNWLDKACTDYLQIRSHSSIG